MSGIINFLKNLVGGIFGFFGGFFGKKAALEGGSNQPSKKSNSGYFLELDDSKLPEPVLAIAATVMSSAEAIADAVNGKAPTQPKKTTRKEKLAAAKASNGSSASITAEKAPSEPKSVPVDSVMAVPSEVGFATKYPIQITGGRRRPGANMNSYLDMARQMK